MDNLLNSELQFFMNDSDEAQFVAFAGPLSDSIDRQSDIQWFLCVDAYRIQLLRCRLYDGVLIGGRIALRTAQDDEDAKRAESLFNRFRRWLKINYNNQLTVRNVNIPGSTTTCRTHWVGPNLMQDLQGVDAPTLSQNRKAIVVFEVDYR